MGTKVWNSEHFIGMYVPPAIYEYTNGHFRQAAMLLDGFNSFLLGFGVGISDLKQPELEKNHIRDELRLDESFKDYFEKHFRLVSRAAGKYVREALDETIRDSKG